MTDISSISTSASVSSGAQPVAHANSADGTTNTAPQPPASPASGSSTYTALATEASSNIRGTGINQSV